MKLGINVINVDFQSKRRSTVSSNVSNTSKSKKVKKEESKIKAIYDIDTKTFYTLIDNKRYNLKIVNTNLSHLFSTPDNNAYSIWTPKQIFKKRKFEDTITDFWRAFYDGMPIKGIINNNDFIIDIVYYKSHCLNYYNSKI